MAGSLANDVAVPSPTVYHGRDEPDRPSRRSAPRPSRRKRRGRAKHDGGAEAVARPPPPMPRTPTRRRPLAAVGRRPRNRAGAAAASACSGCCSCCCSPVGSWRRSAAMACIARSPQELPDYRWLADYDPPQMSRIYAADSRLFGRTGDRAAGLRAVRGDSAAGAPGLRLGRGPALLGTPGRRCARHRARAADGGRAMGQRAADGRGLDHHPAGRQEHAGRQRAFADAQGARGDPGGAHRAGAVARNASSRST